MLNEVKHLAAEGSNPVQFVGIAASLTLLAMTKVWYNHEKLMPDDFSL
jgi:hypothetical protein